MALQGKVVLITGGAAGIGAATARELAARGALPVLADLDAAALDATAAAMHPRPLTVELDVVDPGGCRAAVEEVLERHGRLDVVWANAGIASFGPLALMDPAAWTRTIEVNVLGVYRTIHAALPSVIAARGYVAITASLASFAHAPGMSAYAVSKAGVEALGNALRTEVAHQGVDVATIHPTWIDTPMVREADHELRAYDRLRAAMRPPFRRVQPVERAAREIADGFERRARRICTPPYVRLAHVLRAAATTRLVERDLRAAAPDIARLFEADVAERGRDGASVGERAQRQLGPRGGPAARRPP